jgi:hypothetical protein
MLTNSLKLVLKKGLANPIVRRGLIIGAGLVVIYLVIVATTGYFIYKHQTSNTWSSMVERIFPYPSVVVDGNVVSLSRFRLEVSARQHYAQVHSIATNEHDTRVFVMNKLTNVILYNDALKKNATILNDSDVTNKLQEIYTEVGGQDKLAKFLKENYGDQVTLSQFRTWIRESLVEAAVQRQVLTHVKVQHILVSIPDGASEQQIADAKQHTLNIKAKITEAAQFGDVAKQFSEDIGSRDRGGDLGTTVQGDAEPIFSQAFEDAIFSLPVGQVSDPVQSKFGWHIVLVNSRDGAVNLSTKEYTEQLRTEAKIKQFLSI